MSYTKSGMIWKIVLISMYFKLQIGLKIGTKLIFLPSNERVDVKTIEVWPKAQKDYVVGDCIGITLSDQIFVDKGNMASDIKNPPKLTNRFESRVFWLSKKKYLSIKNI